jgi:hypothetical protein
MMSLAVSCYVISSETQIKIHKYVWIHFTVIPFIYADNVVWISQIGPTTQDDDASKTYCEGLL